MNAAALLARIEADATDTIFAVTGNGEPQAVTGLTIQLEWNGDDRYYSAELETPITSRKVAGMNRILAARRHAAIAAARA